MIIDCGRGSRLRMISRQSRHAKRCDNRSTGELTHYPSPPRTVATLPSNLVGPVIVADVSSPVTDRPVQRGEDCYYLEFVSWDWVLVSYLSVEMRSSGRVYGLYVVYARCGEYCFSPHNVLILEHYACSFQERSNRS